MWPKKNHKPQVLKVWVLESKTKTDRSYLFFLYRLSFLFPSVHISTSPGSLGRADRNAVCKQSIEKPICHCKQREAQSWSLMQSDPQPWTQQSLLMHTSPLSRCLILVSCTTRTHHHSRLPKCTTAPVLGPSCPFSRSKCNSLWDS